MLRSRSLSAVVAAVIGWAAPAMADTPEPQVIIEARFVTVDDKFLEQLGIDFDFDVAALPVTPEGSPPFVIGVPTGPVVPDPVGLLSREQNAQILISPRIVTPSGEPARIFVGGDVPYIDLIPGLTPPAGAPGKVTFGISLDMLPSIGSDLRILLDIAPRVTEIAGPGEGAPGPAPGIVYRSLETTVTLPARGTLVIGGLLTDDALDAGAKLPVLRDLPVLGALFRNRAQGSDDRDLIILVTPRIVDEEGGGGGGVASAEEPAEVGAADAADAAPPPSPQRDLFTRIVRGMFGYTPCTHPTKPCEVHRRIDEPGNYPNGSAHSDEHSSDKDHQPE